jgi:mannose-6-phosphate isomerase-like protein (cupin superfamily)
MANHKIVRKEEVDDVLGDYPGEMLMYTYPLEAEQAALTWRRMPAKTGSKGSYGHSHKTQEELVLVLSGKLEFKLDDEIVELGPGAAVRLDPSCVRGIWNEGPDDAEIVIVSERIAEPENDTTQHEDFWPE